MTVKARARHHPAARRAWGISGETSLGGHLRQVLYEGVDLLRRQRIAEARGADPGLVPGRYGVGGGEDRLLDEGRVLALEALVEVGAALAVRAGVGERVARP